MRIWVGFLLRTGRRRASEWAAAARSANDYLPRDLPSTAGARRAARGGAWGHEVHVAPADSPYRLHHGRWHPGGHGARSRRNSPCTRCEVHARCRSATSRQVAPRRRRRRHRAASGDFAGATPRAATPRRADTATPSTGCPRSRRRRRRSSSPTSASSPSMPPAAAGGWWRERAVRDRGAVVERARPLGISGGRTAALPPLTCMADNRLLRNVDFRAPKTTSRSLQTERMSRVSQLRAPPPAAQRATLAAAAGANQHESSSRRRADATHVRDERGIEREQRPPALSAAG